MSHLSVVNVNHEYNASLLTILPTANSCQFQNLVRTEGQSGTHYQLADLTLFSCVFTPLPRPIGNEAIMPNDSLFLSIVAHTLGSSTPILSKLTHPASTWVTTSPVVQGCHQRDRAP
jgi:hypothetical protein